MSHDDKTDAATKAGVSRRGFLANLGLLTLVAAVGPSLLLPDEAEASKKRSSKKKSRKSNHGKKVSKVARKKKHSGRKHGKKVSRVARKKGKKKRY